MPCFCLQSDFWSPAPSQCRCLAADAVLPWGIIAGGMLLVTLLNPGFVPRFHLSAYGETALAATAAMTAWLFVSAQSEIAADRQLSRRVAGDRPDPCGHGQCEAIWRRASCSERRGRGCDELVRERAAAPQHAAAGRTGDNSCARTLRPLALSRVGRRCRRVEALAFCAMELGKGTGDPGERGTRGCREGRVFRLRRGWPWSPGRCCGGGRVGRATTRLLAYHASLLHSLQRLPPTNLYRSVSRRDEHRGALVLSLQYSSRSRAGARPRRSPRAISESGGGWSGGGRGWSADSLW